MLIVSKKYLFNVENGFIQRFWFVDDPIDLRFIQFVFDVVQHNSHNEFEFYGCSQCKLFSFILSVKKMNNIIVEKTSIYEKTGFAKMILRNFQRLMAAFFN